MDRVIRRNSGRAFIGTIARQAEVPIQTVRYYEEVGLVSRPSRTDAGYRTYGPGTLDRLRFIKKAQHLGLSLGEIRGILKLSDGGKCPCGHVEEALRAKLKELRVKMQDLKAVENRILKVLKSPGRNAPQKGVICRRIEQHREPGCCPPGPQSVRWINQRRKAK